VGCVLVFQQNRCLWFGVVGSVSNVFCVGDCVWFVCSVG
jgi:hypothetical protein